MSTQSLPNGGLLSAERDPFTMPDFQAASPPVSDEVASAWLDRLQGSMKGSMVIQGNIVDPDPELWDCECD